MAQPATSDLARKPAPVILTLSAAIAAFLIWLIYFKGRVAAPDWIGILPAANALFNSLSAICLICGYINIRRRNRVIASGDAGVSRGSGDVLWWNHPERSPTRGRQNRARGRQHEGLAGRI